ncbi:hypothetical protein ZHAS_00019153 [Anopheles sinensis]|uniref:Uncharacterized protein n=1 Tax=Anopheles sinensis TaxID=74873 RepID=A0A084WLK2_ANOSI|nr:hypothetical protein ZHAS_00019153 [Anopheles sinensis]
MENTPNQRHQPRITGWNRACNRLPAKKHSLHSTSLRCNTTLNGRSLHRFHHTKHTICTHYCTHGTARITSSSERVDIVAENNIHTRKAHQRENAPLTGSATKPGLNRSMLRKVCFILTARLPTTQLGETGNAVRG